MKISIVIPVYNVEKYVDKCLTSCLLQNLFYSDYEIIIVNDGSTDKSLSICQFVTKDRSNVRIFTQENKGLSAARNKGLSVAQGEYVWFVDSDDWIEKNCLSKVCTHLYQCDILAINYIETYTKSCDNKEVIYPFTTIADGKDLLCNNFKIQAQFYIYKRNFLINNNLLFFEGIFHEDFEFTPRALYFSSSVTILPQPVYYFFKRPNSISTTLNPKRFSDMVIVASRLNDFKNRIVEKKMKHVFIDLISLALNNSLNGSLQISKKDCLELEKLLKKKDFLFSNFFKSSILKYRMEAFFFTFFSPFFSKIKIYKMLYVILECKRPKSRL